MQIVYIIIEFKSDKKGFLMLYNMEMSKLISANPANNYSIVGEVTISSAAEISQKVQKAQTAKKAWKELGVQKRIALLEPICEEFAQRQEELKTYY